MPLGHIRRSPAERAQVVRTHEMRTLLHDVHRLRGGRLAEAAFAIGDHQVCRLFISIKLKGQPGDPHRSLILMSATTALEQTDHVIAACGNFCEPEVTGRVGACHTEIGKQTLVGQQLVHDRPKALDDRALSRSGLSGRRSTL